MKERTQTKFKLMQKADVGDECRHTFSIRYYADIRMDVVHLYVMEQSRYHKLGFTLQSCKEVSKMPIGSGWVQSLELF